MRITSNANLGKSLKMGTKTAILVWFCYVTNKNVVAADESGIAGFVCRINFHSFR